jgi:hypothetical protein
LPTPWQQIEHGQRWWTRASILVCLLAFLCAATVQIAHVHPPAGTQDHCQICMAIHSALPADTTAAALAFNVTHHRVAPAIRDGHNLYWSYSLANRPPPAQIA